MDFIEKISSDIDGFLKPIFTDKISSSVISLILVLYAGLAAPKLPKSISKLFENKIFKLIVLVIIAYTASKDASIAIITAVALVLSMQTLSSYEKPVKVVKKVEVKKQDKVDDKKPTDLQEPSSYDTRKNQYHELKNDNIPEIKAPRNTHNKMEAKKNIVRPFSNSEQKYQTVEGFGSYSDTITASFGSDFYLGAVEDENTSQNKNFAIDLDTSFTGEDSLDIAIDPGSATGMRPIDLQEQTDLPLGSLDVTTAAGGSPHPPKIFDDSHLEIKGSYNPEVGLDPYPEVGLDPYPEVGLDPYPEVGLDPSISVGYETNEEADNKPDLYVGLSSPEVGLEPSISVGYETNEEAGNKPDLHVGLSFPEVGPGSLDVAGTEAATEDMIASYSYPLNDGMTITPGVFVEETSDQDDSGMAVKTSFSF